MIREIKLFRCLYTLLKDLLSTDYPGTICRSYPGEIPYRGLRSRISQGTAGQAPITVDYKTKVL